MRKGLSCHIGVNRVDPGHYEGWSGPLYACEADADAMIDIATRCGFEAEILRTEDPMRGRVVDTIRGAASALSAGDIFMLSYSGHGGQVADISGDEDDGADETWCLYDGQLLDDELGTLWAEFREGVRILVFSDSCHSGTVTRAIGMEGDVASFAVSDRELGNDLAYRFMPGDVALPVYRSHQEFYDQVQREALSQDQAILATVRLLSGCQDEQLSREANGHGLFTKALMTVWDGGTFAGNYAEFHEAILTRMPFNQTPNHKIDGVPNPGFESEKPFTV